VVDLGIPGQLHVQAGLVVYTFITFKPNNIDQPERQLVKIKRKKRRMHAKGGTTK
jgi:hypothetical protein